MVVYNFVEESKTKISDTKAGIDIQKYLVDFRRYRIRVGARREIKTHHKTWNMCLCRPLIRNIEQKW